MSQKVYAKNLDAGTISQLEADLQQANESIDKRVKRLMPNTRVMDPDYLFPTCRDDVIPLTDPNGAYLYFTRIRDVLETALREGRIRIEDLPKRAPQYLCDLAK